jgi:hypothetical protein
MQRIFSFFFISLKIEMNHLSFFVHIPPQKWKQSHAKPEAVRITPCVDLPRKDVTLLSLMVMVPTRALAAFEPLT